MGMGRFVLVFRRRGLVLQAGVAVHHLRRVTAFCSFFPDLLSSEIDHFAGQCYWTFFGGPLVKERVLSDTFRASHAMFSIACRCAYRILCWRLLRENSLIDYNLRIWKGGY